MKLQEDHSLSVSIFDSQCPSFLCHPVATCMYVWWCFVVLCTASSWPKITKPLKVVQTRHNKLSNRLLTYCNVHFALYSADCRSRFL